MRIQHNIAFHRQAYWNAMIALPLGIAKLFVELVLIFDTSIDLAELWRDVLIISDLTL